MPKVEVMPCIVEVVPLSSIALLQKNCKALFPSYIILKTLLKFKRLKNYMHVIHTHTSTSSIIALA